MWILVKSLKNLFIFNSKITYALQDNIALHEWHTSLTAAVRLSGELKSRLPRKAGRIYGFAGRDPLLDAETTAAPTVTNTVNN
jgi:hypothetical protein